MPFVSSFDEKSIDARGQLCPYCGSNEFESSIHDWEEPEMIEINECESCKKIWRVGYQIMFAYVETE